MEKQEIMDESAKLVPPAVVSTLSLFGISLQDWVYILTITYLIIQITFAVIKYVRARNKKRQLKSAVKKDGQG